MNKVVNRFSIVLPPALLLILFWFVSFYGLDFGVHWDEGRAKLDSVRKSVETGIFLQSIGEPDGYSYNYGGVNYLLTLSAFAPEFTKYLLDKPHTREALTEAIAPLISTPKIRLRVRAIYLVFSSLSIVWLYCLCRVLDRSRTEAFLAAAILSLSWEVSYHSRWIAPDAVMMQFAVLAFLCLAVGMKKRSLGWLYWAAIVAGLTTGTKYPGALVLPSVLVGAAYTLWQTRSSVLRALKHIAGLTATTGLTFALTTPGALVDPYRFVAQLQEQQQIYGGGWYGYSVQSGLRHFEEIWKYFMLQGFSHYWPISIGLTAFFLLGLLAIAKEHRLIAFLMASFCLFYLVFFSQQRAMIVRNMLVIVPFLCFAAARGIATLAQMLGVKVARVLYLVIALGLAMNLGWEVHAVEQIRKRTDLDYFLRQFEAYAKASTADTFFVSDNLFIALSGLPDRLPDNITKKPEAPFTKIAFLQSEGPDILYEEWPSNRWDTYDKVFSGLEVNLEAYPTFVGNERILVVARRHLARLPITAQYLADPLLTVSKTEIVAGNNDFYVLKIEKLPNANVVIRYSLNGAAPLEAPMSLNGLGETRIDVGPDIAKGEYRLLGYRKDIDVLWHNVDVTVRVK